MITDLAIDENEVAAQMAVAEVPPLTAERVIEKAARQRQIISQHVNGALEQAIEVAAVDAAFLTPEVTAKARGLLNRPHSATSRVPSHSCGGVALRGGPPSWRRWFPCSGPAARKGGLSPWRYAPSLGGKHPRP